MVCLPLQGKSVLDKTAGPMEFFFPEALFKFTVDRENHAPLTAGGANVGEP